MAQSRTLTVLGSTGSIGRSTLELIELANSVSPGQYEVHALTAQSNVERLAEQARRVRAKFVAIGDASKYSELKDRLHGTGTHVAAGPQAVIEAGDVPVDWVMAAIVGSAGLRPTLQAIKRGASIALANKECLVTAGPYVMAQAARYGAPILPVDSEHSAVFQALPPNHLEKVAMVTLTASGGPFRDWSLAQMGSATVKQACAHPNWSMGAKISVDSATLMNKGPELIEAQHLFGLQADKLDVIIHRQSIVHALVAFKDGSVLAQLSNPDMRTPIACALAHPDRLDWPSQRLDLAAIGQLTFEPPDESRFRCLYLAKQCLAAGGLRPTVLNAANEVAVDAFLQGVLPFLAIVRVNESVLDAMESAAGASYETLDAILALDEEARALAQELIAKSPKLAKTTIN